MKDFYNKIKGNYLSIEFKPDINSKVEDIDRLIVGLLNGSIYRPDSKITINNLLLLRKQILINDKIDELLK